MRQKEIFLLTLILLSAFLVRLYKFNGPVADWHSWRQADTSAVSRNFIKHGFDVFHPRFDDLSKGVSLLDNPKGYRFVEFPVYNILQAGLFKTFGYLTLEQWGRTVTIISSLVAIIFLYLIVRKYISPRAGILAALFYALLPYNIYYGRAVLPDTSTVAMMLGGIYFFDIWVQKGLKSLFYFLLALVFTSLALLLKPFVLFFSLPFLYLVWTRYRFKILVNWKLWLFVFLTLLPLVFWRIWMQQFPQGIPRSDWLFNGNEIRFKGAFFHWIFAERIANLILGFFGLPFVVLGILVKPKKEGLFFYSFLISSLSFITVLATGNIQHDYYQILIIPTLALFFAKGVDFILENSNILFSRYVAYLVIIIGFLFMLAFGWFRVRDFYGIHHPEIVEAGKAVNELTPKDAKVIAVYNGDTTFLYYTNRQGWPVFDRSLKEFRKAGATHIAFVSPGKDELNFENEFQTVKKGEKYAIFDLTKPLPAGRRHFLEDSKNTK